MRAISLLNAFAEGKIEKRMFWNLMREKAISLVEYSELLNNNEVCECIEIHKDKVILNTNGMRILFDFSQTYCRAESILSMGGDYEEEDYSFMKSFLKANDVVFDIGANAGLFSLNLMSKISELKIYAFEPLKPTYEKMLENLDLNPRLKKGIETFNLGFSSKKGMFAFYLPGASEAASMKPIEDEFYLRESDAKGIYTGRKKQDVLQCNVDTVDSFCKEHFIEKIDLLKCDAEGAERDILLGAKNSLLSYQPIVYCELLRKHARRFGYHPNDVIHYMKELGYCCITVRNHAPTIFEEMTDETEETNFFFLHELKHEKTILSLEV